jgi:alpha-D-ribose 1-methylphosphonate 5-triphosphate diphosphatase PhnM
VPLVHRDNIKRKIADALARSLPVISQICNDDAMLMMSVTSNALVAILLGRARDPVAAAEKVTAHIKSCIQANMEAMSRENGEVQ